MTEGTIGQGNIGQMVAILDEGDKGYDVKQARNIDRGRIISPEPINTYLAEISEFSQAIIENRPPANNAELGLRNQKLISACYESAKREKIVAVT